MGHISLKEKLIIADKANEELAEIVLCMADYINKSYEKLQICRQQNICKIADENNIIRPNKQEICIECIINHFKEEI